MQCIIKDYKLVWTQGNRVFSTMHDTLEEAKQQQSIVVGPTMIMMKLRSSNSGDYEWVLLPNAFTWLAKNYVVAFLGLLFMGVGLGYTIKSSMNNKKAKDK